MCLLPPENRIFRHQVFKNAQHSLSTKVYTKPGYIYKTSYHPKSQINNIPYGHPLRLKRICTEETDLDQAIQNLKEGFEKRIQINAARRTVQENPTCEQKGLACIQGKQSRQYNQIHYKIQSKSPRRAQSHP